MSNRVDIQAYIEEKEFTNDKGEVIKYLTLNIPVTENTVKSVKVDKFVLELARDYATSKSKSKSTKADGFDPFK